MFARENLDRYLLFCFAIVALRWTVTLIITWRKSILWLEEGDALFGSRQILSSK